MPRHTPPADLEVCDLCGAYVANKPQHVYWHSRITPVLDAHENDDAQTVTLPAVRDSIGPRRGRRGRPVSTAQLPPPAEEPAEEVLDLREKLEHAHGYLRDARCTREQLAGALHEPGIALPPWFVQYLDTELHAADHRVNLWRDVVAELERRLAAAGE